MSLRRSLAMTRHEVRILFRNPLPFGILIAMPLLVIAFARPIYEFVASGQGYRGTTGAEYAVSGFGVMFAFFLVGNVGLTFFREYGWLTWDRLRVTSARPSEIIVGKIVPLVSLAVVQQLTLWTAGGVLFDLHVRGPLTALALVALALSSCVVAFGCAVVALAKSMIHVSIVQGLGSMLFAGLGGAITPPALLPPWARRRVAGHADVLGRGRLPVGGARWRRHHRHRQAGLGADHHGPRPDRGGGLAIPGRRDQVGVVNSPASGVEYAGDGAERNAAESVDRRAAAGLRRIRDGPAPSNRAVPPHLERGARIGLGDEHVAVRQ